MGAAAAQLSPGDPSARQPHIKKNASKCAVCESNCQKLSQTKKNVSSLISNPAHTPQQARVMRIDDLIDPGSSIIEPVTLPGSTRYPVERRQ